MNPDGTPFTPDQYEAYVRGHGHDWSFGTQHSPPPPTWRRYTLSDQTRKWG